MRELTNDEFAALMRQYQRLVYTVCVQFVHDPATAEDLTQETFLSAFSRIDACDPAYRKQWLVRVAANKCKDHLKSAWVRRVRPLPEEDEPSAPPGAAEVRPLGGAPPPDPAAALETAAGEQELRELITSLRQPYGPVATMYLLEQRTVAQIAQALGRPQATVQSQLFRAKLLLRQQIEERRLR